MRIVTELSEHLVFGMYVNMTKDEKLLLEDFKKYVSMMIWHCASTAEDSEQFGEHTDAVIGLLHELSDWVNASEYGYDTLEEHNQAVQEIRDLHEMQLSERQSEDQKESN